MPSPRPALQNEAPLRVSIIITNYNYAAWLRTAIDSALAQTWSAIEVIVIDDGSIDSSPAIIASYGKRIKALYGAHRGQCGSCNVAFGHCTGDIVIFLDSDDALLPSAAALHVAAFREHPGTVKSSGYMDVIDENGTSLSYRIPRRLPASGDYCAVTQANGIEGYQQSFTSGQAWSRNFLTKVLPIPDEDATGPDCYLSAIDRLFGRLAFIPEAVAQYRRHSLNRGPARFRFDRDYMLRRVRSKRHRIAFAETWLVRLGLPYDAVKLHRMTDWRLVLMQHVLHRMGADEPAVSLRELVSVPFRKRRKPTGSATATSLALLLARLLPKPHDLAYARWLLAWAYRSRGSSG
jgi:glycosyltransferase involved in cell wall biosynthesis